MLSVDEGDATVTVPKELPPKPIVEVGFSVSDVGGCCGVSVSCAWVLTPFQLAVIVTVVFVVTAFVWIGNETEKLPGATNADEGGLTADELLERLTKAPLAGAWPFSITIAPACAPPLMVLGEIESDFSDGGSTLNEADADAVLSVAVSVTGVGEVTCPACMKNCVQAVLPGIVIVDGTGAAVGFELVSVMVAPLAGTAAVSCTATAVESPLNSGLVASVTDTGVGGAELTVNVPVVEKAVTAAVVGEASPWCERTRQNFVPGVSDSTVRDGWLSCGARSSIVENPESLAICSSYPPGCGLGTSVHVSMTGSVTVVPLAGDTGDGGGGSGLLKKTEKVMRFDGAPAMPFAFTANTRAQ